MTDLSNMLMDSVVALTPLRDMAKTDEMFGGHERHSFGVGRGAIMSAGGNRELCGVLPFGVRRRTMPVQCIALEVGDGTEYGDRATTVCGFVAQTGRALF